LSCTNVIEAQADLDGGIQLKDCSPYGRLLIAADLPVYDGQA